MGLEKSNISFVDVKPPSFPNAVSRFTSVDIPKPDVVANVDKAISFTGKIKNAFGRVLSVLTKPNVSSGLEMLERIGARSLESAETMTNVTLEAGAVVGKIATQGARQTPAVMKRAVKSASDIKNTIIDFVRSAEPVRGAAASATELAVEATPEVLKKTGVKSAEGTKMVINIGRIGDTIHNNASVGRIALVAVPAAIGAVATKALYDKYTAPKQEKRGFVQMEEAREAARAEARRAESANAEMSV